MAPGSLFMLAQILGAAMLDEAWTGLLLPSSWSILVYFGSLWLSMTCVHLGPLWLTDPRLIMAFYYSISCVTFIIIPQIYTHYLGVPLSLVNRLSLYLARSPLLAGLIATSLLSLIATGSIAFHLIGVITLRAFCLVFGLFLASVA